MKKTLGISANNADNGPVPGPTEVLGTRGRTGEDLPEVWLVDWEMNKEHKQGERMLCLKVLQCWWVWWKAPAEAGTSR